jgi:hypothetical protein
MSFNPIAAIASLDQVVSRARQEASAHRSLNAEVKNAQRDAAMAQALIDQRTTTRLAEAQQAALDAKTEAQARVQALKMADKANDTPIGGLLDTAA